MLLIALLSNLVNMESGTSGVMGTTATVARLDAMCFVSLEPGGREGGREGGRGGRKERETERKVYTCTNRRVRKEKKRCSKEREAKRYLLHTQVERRVSTHTLTGDIGVGVGGETIVASQDPLSQHVDQPRHHLTQRQHLLFSPTSLTH